MGDSNDIDEMMSYRLDDDKKVIHVHKERLCAPQFHRRKAEKTRSNSSFLILASGYIGYITIFAGLGSCRNATNDICVIRKIGNRYIFRYTHTGR